MLGLPESGKTSYLAALYELISHDDVPGALRIEALPADRQYLQTIHERWLRCEPAIRSRSEQPQSIRFSIRIETGELRPLSVPDVAGESVRKVWEERRWDPGLLDLAASASAVMLFVRSDEIHPPKRIKTLSEPVEDMPGDEGDEGDEEPDTAKEPFDASKAPTQVKLTDLLQSTLKVNPARPLRVAVVLSAWDCVEREEISPYDLLRIQLPLLWQYLQSNPERILYHVFGVSAQGGEFSESVKNNPLLKVFPPSTRSRFIDGQEVSHDVSGPLRWLWAQPA